MWSSSGWEGPENLSFNEDVRNGEMEFFLSLKTINNKSSQDSFQKMQNKQRIYFLPHLRRRRGGFLVAILGPLKSMGQASSVTFLSLKF